MLIDQQIKQQIFLTKFRMKPHFNEYYQCTNTGYVKRDNVPIDDLPVIKEVPVASRCNEILPYKLHKLQVMQPVVIDSAHESTRQLQQPSMEIPLKQKKKQNSMNYSFSMSLIQHPDKILQKDEVHSIHLDDKSTARIQNINVNSVDLTKSTYTNIAKKYHSPDMKRSLFSTNNSSQTNYTNLRQSNLKLETIVGEMMKEKQKREEFQKKYEILLNLVNRVEKNHETTSGRDLLQKSQEKINRISVNSPDKNKNTKSNKKKMYVKSNTSSQEESSDSQRPIIVDYKKSRRKGSSPSPIIINLTSPQTYRKSPCCKKSAKLQSRQQNLALEQNQTQVKQDLFQIRQQVQILQENVSYLQKKIEEQQIRHQKQILMQELKEKQRKIQEVLKQNTKIKEINELLVSRRVEPAVQGGNFFGIKIEKNIIGVSFLISLILILLVLNFRSVIC